MTAVPPALPGRAWNKRLKESHNFTRLLLGKADMRVDKIKIRPRVLAVLAGSELDTTFQILNRPERRRLRRYRAFEAASLQRRVRNEPGVASLIPFGEWNKIFPDQAMTVAVVDRLVHPVVSEIGELQIGGQVATLAAQGLDAFLRQHRSVRAR
jgi:IstB-like ATP binding protein